RKESRGIFKGRPVAHLVRDEGVAGSNPATPTKYPLATLNFHNYPQRLPISKRRAQRRTQTRVADGWTLAAAPKRLLRPTEGDDSPRQLRERSREHRSQPQRPSARFHRSCDHLREPLARVEAARLHRRLVDADDLGDLLDGFAMIVGEVDDLAVLRR